MTGRLLYRGPPEPPGRHNCAPPGGWRHPIYPPGSIWQCDECQRLWVVRGGFVDLLARARSRWLPMGPWERRRFRARAKRSGEGAVRP